MAHSTSVLAPPATTRDAEPADLPAILRALDTMVASAEPAVVFTSAVRVCVPLISAGARVTITEPDQLAYAITWPGNPNHRLAAPTFVVRTLVIGEPTDIHAEYCGTLTLHVDSAPTAEQTALAQLVVDRAVALVHRERLTELLLDETTRAEQLIGALRSNRDIGMAMGILMGLDKVTREHAFDVLRDVSRRTHRKLRDIAVDIIETGTAESLVDVTTSSSGEAGPVEGDRPGRRIVRCAS